MISPVKHLRSLFVFLGGLLLTSVGVSRQDMMVTFFGFALLGCGWVGVLNFPGLALPNQGHNPRPRPLSNVERQTRELEEADRDTESQIRAVVVEFLHRPLSDESIAELEREVELALKRDAANFSRALAGVAHRTRWGRPLRRWRRTSSATVSSCRARRSTAMKTSAAARCVRPRSSTASDRREQACHLRHRKIRYDQLEYGKVLIVNGSHDPVADAGYEKIRQRRPGGSREGQRLQGGEGPLRASRQDRRRTARADPGSVQPGDHPEVKTEEEYTQWHDDGHEMTVEVCIEVNTGMPEGAAARKSTFTQVKVHCPEDSFCHRWAREHAAEHFCFVRNEIDAVGHWDFIEQMDTAELPRTGVRASPSAWRGATRARTA
jgi:hypothetical protein